MKKLTILLIILLLTTGCSSLFAFTPERAAMQRVMQNPDPNFRVDPASVRVLQTQPVGEAVIALVSFTGQRSGTKETCSYVYVLERGRLGWRSPGGGGGCQSGQGAQNPIEIGSGWNGTGGPDPQAGYSHTAGLVNQEDVTSVEVAWDDGEIQTVDVFNSSYLAGRTGQNTPTRVRALNAQGEEVHAWSPPQPPPGKVEPTAVP